MLSIAPEEVNPAFGRINNQFIGILCGVISAELYNRFSGIELPKFLAFFSGKRFVPIITSGVMIVVSFILMYVWPLIFSALSSFGVKIASMGAVGAGIYGFFNRLLIPVGLHHALNSVFWFNLAGINDIGRFWGAPDAAYADLPAAIQGAYHVGMYQAGFFPIMMFGLLGACAAFVKTAKVENRAKVMSIMTAAGFASFFTGVTEPIEFAFMFVAPVLYLLHAVLTGIAVFLAASFNWMAGFGFSAGLVDLVLSSRNPNAHNWYMLIVLGIIFFVVYYLVFYVAITKFDLKTPGREMEEEEMKAQQKEKISNNLLANQLIPLLGGSENIEEIDYCTTRLRLRVKESANINDKEIKKLVPGLLKPSKNTVQVIIGPEVEFIADEMKRVLNK